MSQRQRSEPWFRDRRTFQTIEDEENIRRNRKVVRYEHNTWIYENGVPVMGWNNAIEGNW